MESREKTYRELREEIGPDEPEQLNELRLVRAGSALVFARNAKKHGDKLVSNAKKGQSILSRIKQDTPTEKRIELTAEALDVLFDCLMDARSQVGNLVGISLASTLISERSNKEITKLNKQRR